MHGKFQTASAAALPLDVTELGQVLSGADVGRTYDDEVTVVDLTGIAAQDI